MIALIALGVSYCLNLIRISDLEQRNTDLENSISVAQRRALRTELQDTKGKLGIATEVIKTDQIEIERLKAAANRLQSSAPTVTGTP
jgi:hypothetical protein